MRKYRLSELEMTLGKPKIHLLIYIIYETKCLPGFFNFSKAERFFNVGRTAISTNINTIHKVQIDGKTNLFDKERLYRSKKEKVKLKENGDIYLRFNYESETLFQLCDDYIKTSELLLKEPWCPRNCKQNLSRIIEFYNSKTIIKELS